jgi:hypothetical protein
VRDEVGVQKSTASFETAFLYVSLCCVLILLLNLRATLRYRL